MSQDPFEDFEIQRDSGDDNDEPILDSNVWPEEAFERSGGRGGTPIWAWLLAIGVVAILAGGIWWWMHRGSETPTSTARAMPATEPAVEAPEPESVVPAREEPEPDPEMPGLEASDPYVRTLVRTVSAHPKLVEWLANDELVRRFTLVICNFAYDEAPALHVPFLRPRGPFRVIGQGDTARIDPSSYERYDLLGDVVASLDAPGSVEAYQRLRPLIDQVYQELGYPGSFDQTLRRALRKLREVPRLPEEVDVRAKVLSYEFADPALEELTGPQKQLLRMGPDNVRRIQAKANEIGRLLDS